MTTITQGYAEFINDLKFEDLPSEVVTDIKMRVLDSLGIMIAANRLDTTKTVDTVVEGIGGVPQCTVVGTGAKLPMVNVPIINGTMAHSFDFDDTHTGTLIHASACIIPTALAVTEGLKLSGKDLITMATAGFEVALRMGLAKPRGCHTRGFHSTSVFGVFGASAIAAKGLKLDKEKTAMAIGMAASFACGVMQCLKDGTDIKIIHAGWAGHGGIMSALLAQNGFTGPSEAIEGEIGFFNAYLSPVEYDINELLADFKKRWETLEISFKLYPACHFTHGYIECIKTLKKKYTIDPEKIKSVEVKVAQGMVPIVCEPKEDKKVPLTEYGERFSMYYAVASAILEDKITINTLSLDKLTDPRYTKLAQKVDYTVYDFEGFPKLHPGWVIITMDNGDVYEERVECCKGPFGVPIVFDDIEDKFRGNTDGVLSVERQDEIVNLVKNLEKLSDIDKLMSLTVIK